MLNRLIASDDSYKEMISRYTKTDALLAISMYMFLLLVHYAAGKFFANNQIYLGAPLNVLLVAVCVALAKVRRQRLSTVGFTLKNISKALLVGSVFSVFSFFICVLPKMLAYARIIPLNRALYNIFFYFIIISLSEEVIFRGYIQTRMYGLIGHDTAAITITGFLFYVSHLPYQMIVNGMQINLKDMAIIIALHFVMNFLYRKYNSLAAPTVFHGLLNWSNYLFLQT